MLEASISKSATSIFKCHYQYYNNIGIETIKQQAGQIEQVSADYQGRVIYELLQNAFDKAERLIFVKIFDDKLLVANDGCRFTYKSDYDYKGGNSGRGDFQSLCSISTSTKSIATSIGNKGVGFKSVFSIADGGFVNVYTQGEIIEVEEQYYDEIGFRIYESFKDASNVPNEFPVELKNEIKIQIDRVQLEMKTRGVPGYYFPLQISTHNPEVQNLFRAGYVTVIEVPFSQETRQVVNDLFSEITKVHFQFVQIKYNKEFEIRFENSQELKTTIVSGNKNRLFTAQVKDENLVALAKDAGLEISHSTIGIVFRNDPGGLLFNYLPTKVRSPFDYVDFHADFQTKVDRTNINFDPSGKVGKYNALLFRACFELYFSILCQYANISNDLRIQHIDLSSINYPNLEFNWNYLKTWDSYIYFNNITSILKISNWEYQAASSLFAAIAKAYFSQERKIDEYKTFYTVISSFLTNYSSDTSQYYLWVERFKDVLANKLLDQKINLLPGILLTKKTEIFYRKGIDNPLQLPSFSGVAVTDFEIEDKELRKKLNINDFDDYNAILKYIKQVSYSGEFEKVLIKEEEQLALLRALVYIFKNKRETFPCSTHRYSKVFNSGDRSLYSVTNQAYFGISTVFLKVRDNKYKPAQLCRKNDLDLTFISNLKLNNELDDFLKFIGVSLDTYIFCDKRIYESLKDGIDYIPRLRNDSDSAEKLLGQEVLKNVTVISTKGKMIHPALINANNYSFLEYINNRNIRLELDQLLVEKYYSFPKEYLEILYAKLSTLPNGIERLYKRLFIPLHSVLGKYLLRNKEKLHWGTDKTTFFIAQNINDYDLLKRHDIVLLCFYNGNEIPSELHGRIVSIIEGDIVAVNKTDITSIFKSDINNRMAFILAAISYFSLSELDFRDNSSKIRELQTKMNQCKVYECKTLNRKTVTDKNVGLEFDNMTDFALDNVNLTIYFSNSCSDKRKAEAISLFLFNNSNFSRELELILLKEPEELENDYNKEDLLLFKRLWIHNYNIRFKKFQKSILQHFENPDDPFDDHWYSYDKNYKSPVLLRIYQENKLNILEVIIQKEKSKNEGLFDDFAIQIDFTMNNDWISKLIAFLQDNDEQEAVEFSSILIGLSGKIGVEDKIDAIEQKMIEKYKYNKTDTNENTDSKDIKMGLDLNSRIDQIYGSLSPVNSENIEHFAAAGEVLAKPVDINFKKLIFQGKDDNGESGKSLEITGANGEEQVLSFYISQILLIDSKDRCLLFDKIDKLIRKKLGDDSHSKYKDACVKANDNEENLIKALIPFLYISLHHKFSYFDLIGVREGEPIIVEVKSTSQKIDRGFYISASEINEARRETNYELARVNPDKIVFMGNPVKEVEEKIEIIAGENYRLIPRNYKFEFIKIVSKLSEKS